MVPVGSGLGDRGSDALGLCQEVVRWQKNVSVPPAYCSMPSTDPLPSRPSPPGQVNQSPGSSEHAEGSRWNRGERAALVGADRESSDGVTTGRHDGGTVQQRWFRSRYEHLYRNYPHE
jgi:hypothetical protein